MILTLIILLGVGLFLRLMAKQAVRRALTSWARPKDQTEYRLLAAICGWLSFLMFVAAFVIVCILAWRYLP